MRISGLVSALSSASAVRISRSLRVGVVSTAAWRSASVWALISRLKFLTYCCSMVEPPRVSPPPVRNPARPVRVPCKSTPL